VWGQAASYVSGDDPAELAAAVNGLLERPARRARAAAAAQARARRYTAAVMAAAYRRAYDDTARAPVIA
jgi:glycosyltransferase involved in cell wall biosynthesis